MDYAGGAGGLLRDRPGNGFPWPRASGIHRRDDPSPRLRPHAPDPQPRRRDGAWPGAARPQCRPRRRRPRGGRPGAGHQRARPPLPQPDRPGRRLRQECRGGGAADAARLRLRRGRLASRRGRRPAIPGRGCSGWRRTSGVINRMGFNNGGLDASAARLAALPRPLPAVLGANIGGEQGRAPSRAARLPRALRRAGAAGRLSSRSTSPRPIRPACATCRGRRG